MMGNGDWRSPTASNIVFVDPVIRVTWHLWPTLWRWFLSDDEKLVRVKSLRPSWGRYGLEWPMMLVDRKGGSRCTVQPCWDWRRVVAPWRHVEIVN